MPSLRPLGADGDQHVELCGEATQRRGFCREETRDQALFIVRGSRLFLPGDE